jgi:hypothetical protein
VTTAWCRRLHIRVGPTHPRMSGTNPYLVVSVAVWILATWIFLVAYCTLTGKEADTPPS